MLSRRHHASTALVRGVVVEGGKVLAIWLRRICLFLVLLLLLVVRLLPLLSILK